MAITRIKNNQITDATITGGKLVNNTITAGKLEDDLTYGSNLTVTGNLTVSGTTVAVDTSTMTVEDPILLLASNQTGSGATDVGFIGERGDDTNVAFVWDESANTFIAAETSSADSNTVIVVTDYAPIRVGGLTADDNATIGGTLGVTGAATMTASTTFNGGFSVAASQTISAGSNKITNVTDPAGAQDAATKAYVDAVSSTGWTLSDGTTTQTISGSDTLTLAGTANEVNVAVSATDTMTIGLPDDVTIGDALTVTGAGSVGSTLGVTGATTLSSTLDVAGLASLDGGIDTDGAFTVANTTGNVATSGTLAVTGNTTVGGTLGVTGASTVAAITASGLASLDGGIDTDGAFTVANTTGNVATSGTLGVTGNTTVGGTLGVTGATTLSSTLSAGASTLTSAKVSDLTSGRVVLAGTAGELEDSGNFTFNGSTVNVTGVVTTTGNVNVGGALDVTGNAVIDGNLTVSGTTTTVDSTVVEVADPILTLGSNASDDNLDRGIKMKWHNGSAAKNAFMGYDDSATEFVMISDATDTSSVITGSLGSVAVGSLRVTDLTDNRVLIAGSSGEVEDSGNLTFDGSTLGLTGAATVSSTLAVTGNTTVGGTLGITGETTLASAIVSDLTDNRVVIAGTSGALEDSGNLTFDGSTLGLTGAATVSSTLAVTGNTTVGGTLGVTGAATLSSTLGVTGASTLASAAVTNNATVGGTLGVTGATGVDGNFDVATNKFTVASATGNTAVAGTLGVTGASTLSSTLAVAGLASLNGGIACDTSQFTVSGATGAVSTESTLNADGATTLGSTLAVTGNSTVGGTLGVTGATTLSSTLAVTGATTIAGAVTINDAGGDVDVRIEGDSDASLFITDAGTDTILIGTATPVTGAKLVISDTGSLILPQGTTAQRPGTGAAGMFRFNTTAGYPEYHTGSAWKQMSTEFTVIATETFDGDGSTVAFTLASSQTTASCIVSINGVVQLPTTAYAVSTTTLTFTEAPASGDKIEVRELTTTETITGISNAAGNAMIESPVGTVIEVTGNIQLKAQGDVRFADSDSSNYVAFQAPATVASNVTWTLPSTDASVSGYALVSDASGTLSFAAAGATITSDTSTDTDFLLYFASTTSGALTGVKQDSGFTYNPSSGTATADTFVGNVTGNVTGNTSGTAATVTTAAQPAITSLGTLTTLAVDNITINGNDISSTAGTDLTITPLAGQQLVLDGTIIVDAGAVTGATSITSTAFVGDLTGDVTGTASALSGTATITGTPTAPTAAANTNTTQIATTAFVQTEITDLIGGAPGALDTLNELAAAINDDSSYASTVTTALGTKMPTAGGAFTGAVTTNSTFDGVDIATRDGVLTSTTTTANAALPKAGGAMTGAITTNSTFDGVDIATRDAVLTSTTTTANAAQAAADCVSANTANKVVKRDGSGNFAAGTITATCTTAQYADLAENYSADADYAPGTVVCFGGDAEVTQCNEDGDRKIAGVVSTDPAYVMNSSLEGTKATVALQGRVPCKVTGSVQKGDMMVSAGNGRARAEADPKMGSVIGKALENSEGENTIEVVIGRV